MVVTLFLRKITASDEFPATYIKDLPNFLSADLSDDQLTKFFSLLEARTEFVDNMRGSGNLTKIEMSKFRLFAEENGQTGYSLISFPSLEFYQQIVSTNSKFINLTSKTNDFFESVGWSFTTVRYINHDVGEFNEEIQDFDNFSPTFNSVEQLYNNAIEI